ncbi:MAG: helix-turn-helix domain-containing protein [Thermoleophilia bacterium]|nr:helix-turn-helix domain-containing protein [Thermoleophilia bacterium]
MAPAVASERAARDDVLRRPAALRVVAVLDEAPGPLNARQVADALGLHHTGVRVQLNALVECGLAERNSTPPRGRGRPTLLYTLAPDPDGREAAGHRELVRMLTGLVTRMGLGPADMESFGEGQAHRVCTEGAGPGELRDAFARLGFAPEEVDGPEPRDIVLRHCPFAVGVEAAGGSQICALHRGLARGIARVSGSGLVVDLVEEDPRTAGCLLRLSPAPA